MDASELISTLLILFFFLAAVVSPIIQQLRSAARQRRQVQRSKTSRSTAADTSSSAAAEKEASHTKRAVKGSSARPDRAGKTLRNLFRRNSSKDSRETDPYRDLMREDRQSERLRFGKETGDGEPGTMAQGANRYKSAQAGREHKPRLAAEESSAWPSEKEPESAFSGRLGSSWTASGIEQRAIGTALRKRHPRGQGFKTIRALPPLQRGVIMAELLGKPKALQEKPYDR